MSSSAKGGKNYSKTYRSMQHAIRGQLPKDYDSLIRAHQLLRQPRSGIVQAVENRAAPSAQSKRSAGYNRNAALHQRSRSRIPILDHAKSRKWNTTTLTHRKPKKTISQKRGDGLSDNHRRVIASGILIVDAAAVRMLDLLADRNSSAAPKNAWPHN
jgi:hypothetical protein